MSTNSASSRPAVRRRALAVFVAAVTLLASMLAGAGARAAPPSPDRPLPPAVDIIDEYQGQTLCDPTPKPGALALRTTLWETYGSSIWAGISRDCNAAWDRGISEHKDGRAIDWGVSVRNSTKAMGDEFAKWAAANRGEMARRMGIMYIIWDSRMWRTYGQDRGWTEYSSCLSRYTSTTYDTTCHRDHMHISMTWHGAGADTSWYDGTPVVLPGCRATVTPRSMGPGSASAPSVLFDPLQGVGTADPCYLDSGIQAIKVGAPEPGRTTVQRLRVEQVGLNAPSQVRIWSSSGSITVGQRSGVPADYELPLGDDGLIYFQAPVGQAQPRVLGLGQSRLVPAGSTIEVPVAGRAGVPVDAAAASLNVTVTEPLGPGYLTVFPCGTARPETSTLNFTAGVTVANSALVGLGGGKACVFSTADAHVVVDFGGYFPAGSALQPQQPQRLLDTRAAAPLAPGGQAVVRLPGGAAAAALNVTATEPAADGWVAVYPCGGKVPRTSSLNFVQGQTIANGTIAAAGEGGAVCLRSMVSTQVIVDVTGLLPPGSGYTASTPVRLADSREVPGQRVPAQRDFAFAVTPGTATAAINLTVTDGESAGWALAYPCGSPVPTASMVNFAEGQTIANAGLVRVGPDGRICVRSNVSTHVVADLSGALSPSLFRASAPVRLLDTRTQ